MPVLEVHRLEVNHHSIDLGQHKLVLGQLRTMCEVVSCDVGHHVELVVELPRKPIGREINPRVVQLHLGIDVHRCIHVAHDHVEGEGVVVEVGEDEVQSVAQLVEGQVRIEVHVEEVETSLQAFSMKAKGSSRDNLDEEVRIEVLGQPLLLNGGAKPTSCTIADDRKMVHMTGTLSF